MQYNPEALIVDMGCQDTDAAKAVYDAAIYLATTQPECSLEGFGVVQQLEGGGCSLASLPDNFRFHTCTDIVPMDGGPSSAIRMAGSTMNRAINWLREGGGAAIISSGNTKAYVAAASSYLERISGDLNVILGAYMPFINPRADRAGTLILDVGGCPDASAEQMACFPKVGAAYSRFVYGVENPISGLLNIGSEAGKGNAFYKDVQRLMGDQCFNLEPGPFMKGDVDVAVVDGHAGNLIIKLLEATFKEQHTYLHRKLAALEKEDQNGTRERYHHAGHAFKEMMMPIAMESGAAQLFNLKQGAFKLHGALTFEQAQYGMKLMYKLSTNMGELMTLLKNVHLAKPEPIRA